MSSAKKINKICGKVKNFKVFVGLWRNKKYSVIEFPLSLIKRRLIFLCNGYNETNVNQDGWLIPALQRWNEKSTQLCLNDFILNKKPENSIHIHSGLDLLPWHCKQQVVLNKLLYILY